MSLVKKAQYAYDVSDLDVWEDDPVPGLESIQPPDEGDREGLMPDGISSQPELSPVDDVNDLFFEEDVLKNDADADADADADIEGDVLIQLDNEEPQVLHFKLPNLPGAESDEDIVDEDEIEVDEEDDEIEVAERDAWDWESGGLGQFLDWLHGMFNRIPKYYGHETSGVERAIAFLSKLDLIISKAVRSDLKEELDISQVETARKEIRDGVKRLYERLDRLSSGAKKKKAKSSGEYQDMLVKNAQKITGVNKTTITVDILLARVAKVCINGMVSAGHDIEDMFDRQVKKYNLNVREQASVMQLLDDMGYPLRRDRGFLLDEEIDRTRSDNFDWNANYPA